jgi:gliding motility associated protien GldN
MKNLTLSAFFLTILMLLSANSFAQKKESYDEKPGGGKGGQPNDASSSNPVPSARDGLYDKISVQEKQVLGYDHLREADIFWQKRVWRVIDTDQKMNQTFSYPAEPFITVLLDVVQKNPNIRLYSDDLFKQSLTFSEVEQQLGAIDTITVVDPVTYEEKTTVVKNDFNWMNIKKFRMKEDWVFDKESSKMVVRILAIAPIEDVYDENDNFRGQRAMFYAYYPDLREHLIKREVFNPFNDSNRLTWDDLFEMRMFGSFIMKESNIQDRRIQDYATDRDALLESERIKFEIFEKEQNLWQH